MRGTRRRQRGTTRGTELEHNLLKRLGDAVIFHPDPDMAGGDTWGKGQCRNRQQRIVVCRIDEGPIHIIAMSGGA